MLAMRCRKEREREAGPVLYVKFESIASEFSKQELVDCGSIVKINYENMSAFDQ